MLLPSSVHNNDDDISSSESDAVRMCGKGEIFSASDEEIVKINKLLTDSGVMPLSGNLMRLYKKAVILGKTYSSRKNKRAQKQNSYTVRTCLDTAQYGLIEFFLSTKDHFLAAITVLNIQKGIPHSISPDEVTLESQSLLFEGYFTYKEESLIFIFANQIAKKCINLSNSSSKLLTTLVNNIELE